MTTEPATVQGRYRLGRELGAGGMGRVWLAVDTTLGREVAVKEILLPEEILESDREALRRHMLLEARAFARVNHANVARVYDAFEVDGRAWIVMEYVPSRSLQQALDADGPLPPERAAQVGLAVLAALVSAHAAGVRHRDVKPANVLLGDDGRVVLTDFGVAAVDGESIATSAGVVVGSPQYMAPERIRDGEAREAGDLWSLGATLYAAVEGRPPYQRASVMETVTAIAADEPEPPHQAGALLPTLEGLLRKDPEQRIDAAETERRLRAVITPPVRRRRPIALVAAATAVIVAGGAAAWVLTRPPEDPTPPPVVSAPSIPAPSTPAPTPTSAAPAPSSPPPATTKAALTLPAGWQRYEDPTGFSVFVPKGWTRSKDGTMVYFRSKGRVLGIDQTRTPAPDPVEDWEGKADYRRGRGDFPGYRQVHIRKVDYFREAADWEFTFNRSGGRVHVNNRGFITAKNQAYGIWWETPDDDWDGARDDLELIFRSFQPRR